MIPTRRGVSLTELVLAVTILALAFLPVIGVMSSSIRGTTKDDRAVRAMHLAQTKLNTALQFPFFDLIAHAMAPHGGATSTGWIFGGTSAYSYQRPSTNLTLTLGPEAPFTTTLRIDNEPVSFTFRTYDPNLRGANPNTPVNWGWSAPLVATFSAADRGLFHRYTLTVTWQDAHANIPLVYTLVGFKANLRE